MTGDYGTDQWDPPADADEMLRRVRKIRPLLLEQDVLVEAAGQLTPEVVEAVKWTGVLRSFIPRHWGGIEARFSDFLRAVIELGSASGSVGWVVGVLGVHLHEIALMDIRAQEEVWGEDVDTWVGSPYMPGGVGTPVEGGYDLTGDWSFSSGTDWCQWVLIGGFVRNAAGEPDRSSTRHYLLPRRDYEIIPDSWDTIGLSGTGSKDLHVAGSFVPAHRTIGRDEIVSGDAARANTTSAPIYLIPRDTFFAGVVNGATLAMAKGVLEGFLEVTPLRVPRGNATKASADPHQLSVLGEASADIETSIRDYLADFDSVFSDLAEHGDLSVERRFEIRRNQVRDVSRAVQAADRLFVHAGGMAIRKSTRIQRAWRDLHTGMNHGANVAEVIYNNYGLTVFGHPLPPGTRL